MADELSPFLKVGLSRGSRWCDSRPFPRRRIAGSGSAVRLSAAAPCRDNPWRALKIGVAFFHLGFELGFHSGLDLDLRDFSDHSGFCLRQLRLSQRGIYLVAMDAASCTRHHPPYETDDREGCGRARFISRRCRCPLPGAAGENCPLLPRRRRARLYRRLTAADA